MPEFFSFSDDNLLIDAIKGAIDHIPVLFEWTKDVLGFLIGLSFPLSLFFFIGII